MYNIKNIVLIPKNVQCLEQEADFNYLKEIDLFNK